MNENQPIPEFDGELPHHAIRVYDSGQTDEFPVLKAFQQYIDAEQAKARKRMLSLCIFFGILMTIVIVVFVFLLSGVSVRNQQLNDRLIEFAMKDRDHTAAPVVVNPPSDNTAMISLAAKIDDLQRQITQARQNSDASEKARADAAEQAAAKARDAAQKAEEARRENERARTAEQIEIERLKALLAAEREKAAKEKEHQKEAELEAYRRRQYPEFYAKKSSATTPQKKIQKSEDENDPIAEVLKNLGDLNAENSLDEDDSDEILDDSAAINYFDETEDDPQTAPKARKSSAQTPSQTKNYAIPVEIRGSRNRWRIPND